MQVRRVYNLQPFLGAAFNTYEVTIEREAKNQTTLFQYLNHLADETALHYIIELLEKQDKDLVDQFIKVHNKRIELEEKLGE